MICTNEMRYCIPGVWVAGQRGSWVYIDKTMSSGPEERERKIERVCVCVHARELGLRGGTKQSVANPTK